MTAVYNNSASVVELHTDDDDFLMRTMHLIDEEPWATYAAELQEALAPGRESSGRLRKLKRFPNLVIDLALRKVRLYTRKLCKDNGPLA